MAQTKEQITSDNKGFAIQLQPSTDLGLAMLIAESEEGELEPVAVVATISEARDSADSDFRDRMRRLEQGEDAVLCPFLYQVWARGTDGRYRLACEIADLLN
jgi:hypothetical protein